MAGAAVPSARGEGPILAESISLFLRFGALGALAIIAAFVLFGSLVTQSGNWRLMTAALIVMGVAFATFGAGLALNPDIVGISTGQGIERGRRLLLIGGCMAALGSIAAIHLWRR